MRWVVRHLATADGCPVNALEVGMALDFLDALESDPLRGVLRQQLLDQILGFWLDTGLGESDIVALLDVVICF